MRHINFFIALIFVLFSFCASSQNTINEENIQKYNTLSEQLDGYYQIQITNSRAFPTVSYDLLKSIESKRNQVQKSFVFIKPGMKVLVLGKNASPQFLDKKTKIIYLTD